VNVPHLGQQPTRPGQPQPLTLDLREHHVERPLVNQVIHRLTGGPLRGCLIEDRPGQGQPRPVNRDPFPHRFPLRRVAGRCSIIG